MDDIVERLRDKECQCVEWKHCTMCEAADEIERLRHELSGVWAVANLLAARLETISSGNEMVLHSYSKALQEARRG